MSKWFTFLELFRLPQWLLVRFLLLFLPPQRVVALLGPPLGWLRMALRPGRLRHLRRVMGQACGVDPGGPEAARLAREWFLEQARLGVESSVHNIIPWERLAALADIRGIEPLREAMAEGRGVIATTAHYGTRLIPLSAIWSQGLRIRELIFKPDPPRSWLWRKVLSRNMAESNLDPERAIYVGEPHRLIRYLRGGGGVAIADDSPGARGVPIRFLGREVLLNPGLAKMARLSGAPVFFYYARRNPDQTHTLYVRRLELPEGEQQAMQAYANVVEEIVLEAPEGWRLWRKLRQDRRAAEERQQRVGASEPPGG